MTENKTKTSKTEFIIAIDDEDSEEEMGDKCDIESNTQSIERSVAQTLYSVLDSIEINEKIVKNVCNEVETELSAEADNPRSVESLIIEEPISSERVVRPVDDIEDADELEVNIYYKDSDNDILFDDMEDQDLEAEDCMVIDHLTTHLNNTTEEEIQRKGNQNLEDMDEDIEIIEECNASDKSKDKVKEVIELSDDEEECVIIKDSFSSKLNTSNDFMVRSQPLKRSNSPVYSSDSFIHLSKPNASSDYKNSSTRAGRRCSATAPNPDSSSSTSSLKDLFVRPLESFSQNTSRFNNSSNEYIIDDSISGDDLIPFLYEEPKPSTSGHSIGSSNVGDIDVISECVKLDRNVVQNVVNLIEDQCTVPFIVRYRQSDIFGIDAEKVRRINNIYNELKRTRERAKEVETTLKKQNRINPRLCAALNRCRNVFEVEHLYRLCRNESEWSEKYRNLGLSDSAIAVLEGKRLDPNHFVNRFAVGLDSVETVKEGWSAIISDIISKDCDCLEYLIAAYKQYVPTLQVVINQEKIEELSRTENPRNSDLIEKYLRFKSFKKSIDKINAHSYMAIERGESIGVLNVYIEFETIILNKLIDYCLLKWNRCISHFLVNSVRIAFNNQLKPSLVDYIRFELRHSAHMTALDVFRNNVKYLLLEPPLRGEYVIGVDPGLESGCKVALVSPWGIPLDCKVLNLNRDIDCAAVKLKELMALNNCSIIALGNGRGCRRFEDLLLSRIKSGFFKPIYVKYKIINESGVSYYSVTNEAKEDLPHFPPHMIGAISIARRLIDPLSELVKADPKRLNVGMYLRDIDEGAVRRAFHEVAVECVSFCGVDVNVASAQVLSKVAALEPTIARMIIEKRERDGLFTSRSQLRNIDGIGWKQFEQCAGFIKIMPSTSRTAVTYKDLDGKESSKDSNKRFASSTDDFDLLDSTIIHPEVYSCANTYIQLIGAQKSEIGKKSIKNKIKSCYSLYSLPEIAQLCNTLPANMKLIIEGLSNSIDFDYRINFAQIYDQNIKHFNELTEGMNLKGRVVNVTPMGAFIDCGIVGGINAYLNAKECVRHSIAVNDNILVRIISTEKLLQRFKVSVIEVYKSTVKCF